MLSVNLDAQKDVTKFFGIPVDGYKPKLIQKFKNKGFTISTDSMQKELIDVLMTKYSYAEEQLANPIEEI